MEIVDPRMQPKMHQSVVETDSASITIGRSTYKLTYTSKLSIACGRQHSTKLSKIARYIPDFSGSPGFILQKQNDAPSAEDMAKRAKYLPGVMGASSRGVISQFIPLGVGMAATLFSEDYTGALKEFLDAEMARLALKASDGIIEERHAEKPACTFDPPAPVARNQKQQLGLLVVGTAFSNFNVVRNMFSDEASQFEEEGPQLLGQITMCDSKARPNTAPMIRFSAPASDLLSVLQDESMRAFVDKYSVGEDADDEIDETD